MDDCNKTIPDANVRTYTLIAGQTNGIEIHRKKEMLGINQEGYGRLLEARRKARLASERRRKQHEGSESLNGIGGFETGEELAPEKIVSEIEDSGLVNDMSKDIASVYLQIKKNAQIPLTSSLIAC